MANADRPRGFAPYGKVKSANIYEAGAAVYPGDLVALASDGQIDPVAAGSTILGCALSYAAAAGDKVLVSDDPEQRYVVQADETEVDAQTDIGNNCDHLATAGNSTYKASRMELDSSTIGTSAAGLTILDIEQRPDNAFGGFVDVIVRINEHQIAGKDAFAGV
jgi:hypothetical protein